MSLTKVFSIKLIESLRAIRVAMLLALALFATGLVARGETWAEKLGYPAGVSPVSPF